MEGNTARRVMTVARRVEAIALMVDFLDLLDGDVDATEEDDMDVEDWNLQAGRSSLLGPGDLDDAEPDDDDTGAAEDEGVGPQFQARERVGCCEFDGV